MSAPTILVTLAALALAGSGVAASSAAFTATSPSPAAGSFATASDYVPPAVTLTTPADGTFTNDTTPTLAGAAGDAAGDSTMVVPRVYAGTTASGTPLQAPSVTRSGASWTTEAGALPEGTYTAQASQSDSAANTATSAPSTFTVDTTRPLSVAVSAVNGGAIAGRPDTGDEITFAFNEPIVPGSVLAGFTGTSTAVRVRFFDSALGDRFTVLTSAGTASINLDAGTTTVGGVTLGGANVVTTTVNFTATMVRSADGASFVITLGTADQSSNRFRTDTTARDMVWSVKAGPQDRATNAMLTTPASRTELDNDVDF